MSIKYLIIISALLALQSCDAEKRLTRLLKNNPELERVEYQIDTLKVVDRIVNDSIIYRDSIAIRVVRTVQTPPTRYEIRYKYKTDTQRERTIRDSFNMVIKETRVNKRENVKLAKQKAKQTKQERRKSKWYLWLLIGVSLGLVGRLLLKKLI